MYTTGNLQNILKQEQAAAGEAEAVGLEDFDLLAVLGRGGFGKVMQVRHRNTDTVYAMKILKKSELRRRRQVSVHEGCGGNVNILMIQINLPAPFFAGLRLLFANIASNVAPSIALLPPLCLLRWPFLHFNFF